MLYKEILPAQEGGGGQNGLVWEQTLNLNMEDLCLLLLH